MDSEDCENEYLNRLSDAFDVCWPKYKIRRLSLSDLILASEEFSVLPGTLLDILDQSRNEIKEQKELADLSSFSASRPSSQPIISEG